MFANTNQHLNRAWDPRKDTARSAYSDTPIQWGGTTCWPRGFTVFCASAFAIILQIVAHGTSVVEEFHVSGASFADQNVLDKDTTYQIDFGVWSGVSLTVGVGSSAPSDWERRHDTLSFPFVSQKTENLNSENRDNENTCRSLTMGSRAVYTLTTIFSLCAWITSVCNMKEGVGFMFVRLMILLAVVFNVAACVCGFAFFYATNIGCGLSGSGFNRPSTYAAGGVSPWLMAASLLVLAVAGVIGEVLPKEPQDSFDARNDIEAMTGGKPGSSAAGRVAPPKRSPANTLPSLKDAM